MSDAEVFRQHQRHRLVVECLAIYAKSNLPPEAAIAAAISAAQRIEGWIEGDDLELAVREPAVAPAPTVEHAQETQPTERPSPHRKPPYSKEEDDTIRSMRAEGRPYDEIARRLPGRTEAGIKIRAHAIGVSRPRATRVAGVPDTIGYAHADSVLAAKRRAEKAKEASLEADGIDPETEQRARSKLGGGQSENSVASDLGLPIWKITKLKRRMLDEMRSA